MQHITSRPRHRLAVAVVLACALMLTQGCAPVIIDRTAVVAPEPPPPPRPEVRPVRPGPRFSWRPGRWRYAKKKKRYAWVPGKWIRIRQPYHHRWIPGHWRQTTDGYVWIKGHWR